MSQFGVDTGAAAKSRQRQVITSKPAGSRSPKKKKRNKTPRALLDERGRPKYPPSRSPFQNVKVENGGKTIGGWVEERTAVFKRRISKPPVDPKETEWHPVKSGEKDLTNFIGKDGLWRFANGDLRKYVFLRDAGQCQYCGTVLTFDTCYLDHVIPWPRGKTIPSNLCVVCPPCNKLKGGVTIPQHLRPLLPLGLTEQANEVARFTVNKALLGKFPQTPNLRRRRRKG